MGRRSSRGWSYNPILIINPAERCVIPQRSDFTKAVDTKIFLVIQKVGHALVGPLGHVPPPDCPHLIIL